MSPADFDADTPPPRRRPAGVPVARFVELPRGESPVAWCGVMDQQGRIPEGSFLAEPARGPFGGSAGWKLVWAPAPAADWLDELPAAGEVVPAGVIDRYEPRAVCWVRGEKARYTVMAPKEPAS